MGRHIIVVSKVKMWSSDVRYILSRYLQSKLNAS